MRLRRGLQLSGLAVLLVLTVAVNLPYRGWLEAKIKSDLAEAGVTGLDFHLSDVTARGITLTDVSMAGQSLEAVTVGYGPLEIMQGNFRKLNATNIVLKQGKVLVGLNEVEVDISPDAEKKHWTGPWKVGAITVANAPIEIPVLGASGVMTREGEGIRVEGNVASGDRQFSADFVFGYDGADSSKAVVTLRKVRLPWNGGVVRIEKVAVPLFGRGAIGFTVLVEKVALDKLMGGMTGEKATATGTISGSVPVKVMRDGSFTLLPGTLKADGKGTLVLSPDLIPGENEQLAQVREALKDFQYNVFSMAVEGGDSKKLSILLSLRGNSPEVYNGREIHLNVHLTGDVIELLSSAMSFTDPQQLLKDSHD